MVTVVTNSLLTNLRLQDKLKRHKLIRCLSSLVGKRVKWGQNQPYYLSVYLALCPRLSWGVYIEWICANNHLVLIFIIFSGFLILRVCILPIICQGGGSIEEPSLPTAPLVFPLPVVCFPWRFGWLGQQQSFWDGCRWYGSTEVTSEVTFMCDTFTIEEFVNMWFYKLVLLPLQGGYVIAGVCKSVDKITQIMAMFWFLEGNSPCVLLPYINGCVDGYICRILWTLFYFK